MIFYYTYIISYLFFSLYCYYIDVLSNPNKVVSEQNKVKYSSSIHLVIFNVCFVTCIAFNIIEYFYEPRPFYITTSIRDLIICKYSSEILFYGTHRLFHTIRFLQKFHKVHHEFSHPIGIRAAYAHPIDYFVGNLIPIGISPFILNTDKYTIVFMVVYGVYTTIVKEHSNYKQGTAHHLKHHRYYNCNYGSIWIDKICKTYRK